MKSAILSVACLVGLVAAQASQLPSCATSCLTEYTSGSGIAGCKQADVKCICSNNSFLDGIACCLEKSCDDQGKADAVKYAQQICSSAGVDVPDEVVCKSSSSTESAASATSTSSSSGSATPSATGSQASASGSSTGTATEGAASSTSSPAAAVGLDSVGGVLGAIMAMLLAL